jgi:hypothetical protein
MSAVLCGTMLPSRPRLGEWNAYLPTVMKPSGLREVVSR